MSANTNIEGKYAIKDSYNRGEVHYTRTLNQSCMQQVKTSATAKMKLFLTIINNFQL